MADDIIKKDKLTYRQRIQKKKQENRVRNLIDEVENIYNYINRNSGSCRKRYKQATLCFVDYLLENHQVQQLANIREEHIKNYIKYRRSSIKSSGEKISETTIRLEITAILFTLQWVRYRKHLRDLREVSYYYYD